MNIYKIQFTKEAYHYGGFSIKHLLERLEENTNQDIESIRKIELVEEGLGRYAIEHHKLPIIYWDY